MKIASLRKVLLASCGAISFSTLSAAPIVNDFASTANLTPYGGSVSFDNNGGSGPLTITVEETSPGTWGVFGGKGIFTWSQWLTLDLEQEQFYFTLSGAQSVGTQSATIVDVAFVIGGVGTITTGPISLTDGGWSFNVYEAASQQFYGGGAVPLGLNFQTQLYIGPVSGSSGEGIAYQLESVAAVPEPGTVLLLGVGAGLLMVRGLRRKTRLG